MSYGYLPKESTNSNINKSILRTLWNNKLIVKALNVRNETQARKWFALYPESHVFFETLDNELGYKIRELQGKAKDFLRNKISQERKRIKKSRKIALISNPLVKKSKIS